MFNQLSNWQMTPCITTTRFPPVWICCIGDLDGKLYKSGILVKRLDDYSFIDQLNKYSLERRLGKHVNSNPCRWTHIPENYEQLVFNYLQEELQYDSLATQLVRRHYYNLHHQEE